jgi:hypothetical protein
VQGLWHERSVTRRGGLMVGALPPLPTPTTRATPTDQAETGSILLPPD